MRNVLTSTAMLLIALLSTTAAASDAALKKKNLVAPVKKGNVQYSITMRERPCPPATPEEAKVPTTLNSVIKMCGYSYSVSANAIDNGELVWESTLYTRDYNLAKDREAQLIHPVSLKIQKGISGVVKNQKGDEFVIWLERGYLTKPPTPKNYPTEK